MSNEKPEPIAIVGSACRFPGGAHSPAALWKLLESPRDVASDIPEDRFDLRGFYHPDGSHHGTTNVRQSYLLQQDLRAFDSTFFNISPNEADSIDPQHRLLLETVYEALESGGHRLESLRGSDTAVYTGTMSVDFLDSWTRDPDPMPRYLATGVNRAILSNRVSYFFDWHGPSMTIDTACSSSLVALHQGVHTLRLGESRVALACGTQVILNPEPFIMESKLSMLSPTGRSRMWDADADGYARGEGVATVVMKRLSDAIADGDHIQSIIRETGSNQDGYSNGITVPSTDAQASLIRKTYARAGLDPENNPCDRPQFFEAHGTGTKAGDPREAAAIHQVFGQRQDTANPLYVGSIKTVIGHLEGAAGLAGLLKASAMVQKGVVAPNLLFNRLNPDIEQYYQGLQVPTQVLPWPELPDGAPRRVSVNSFGFGGSNAHAIIEQYRGPSTGSETNRAITLDSSPTAVTPFLFSALSEASLISQLQAYSEHLDERDDINPCDLAWTLQARRSEFATKAAFSAPSTSQLKEKIDAKLEEINRTPGSTLGVKAKPGASKPGILGVFTGQGAQWPAMGAQLIKSSDFVRKRVQHLEEALATLPPADRPTWQIGKEMLADADTSRIAEAVMSQPLCTALQIILVDLLREAGVQFSAVVGHSSGEIAAAYAAGFLSASDAIRIAYYRGQVVQKAQSGAMLAVGTSWEDASELANLRMFRGRIGIAAHNSAASVTMSGDADAVVHAKKVFDEEKKFARMLRVDKAYHSHHMLPCGEDYVNALKACAIGSKKGEHHGSSCAWFSSVTPDSEPVEGTEGIEDIYWRDNMASAVLFADAVQNAVNSDEQIGLVVEVGPHPALKGPATQNISDARAAPLPYCGTLSRGGNDVEAFSDALGFLWTQMGSRGVDFQSYSQAIQGESIKPKLVVDLPTYQWYRGRSHWSEPRRSRRIRGRKQPPHELLGILSPESNAYDMRWSNVLKISEIPWLNGHKLQGQTVFPAAGYVAMALEAAKNLEAPNTPIELFELQDLSIPKAIPFEEADNSGVETLVTLTGVQRQGQSATAHYSCYALPVTSVGSDRDLDLIATGTVKVVFGTPNADALSLPAHEDHSMFATDTDRFYTSLGELGYGYSGPFRALHDIKRKFNNAVALIDSYPYTDADLCTYLIHPSTLDTAFQLAMAACSAPGDGQLWSLHVPTYIQSIRVNPAVCASMPLAGAPVPARAAVEVAPGAFTCSIDILNEDGQSGMVRIEDLIIKPFAPATKADDRVMFTYTKFDLATPDGTLVVDGVKPSAEEVETFSACERIAYYYHRMWKAEITDAQWSNGPPHQVLLRDWVNHTVSRVSAGQHPALKKEWSNDTAEDIKALAAKYWEHVVIRIITAVGENMPAAIRGETTILEHMTADNMLTEYYEKGAGISTYHALLGSMMKQLAHRYPRAKFIELGAGTGGATGPVLDAAGSTMSSYTYTDISPAFFEQAAKTFSAHGDKMNFRVLDIEKSPASQGYESNSYDIVIAFNVLHATQSLQTTLANTRQLLKPGGYLILMEFTNNDAIRVGTTMAGLPGWWLGADDGRVFSPTVTTREWHAVLRKSGFGGVDTATPEIDGITWPLSIMVAQAVDDRVQFLRRPLSLPAKAPARIENLVILGTGTLTSSRISEELSEYLEPFCDDITVLDGLPTEEQAEALNPLSTFINLADLDDPIFKNMDEEKLKPLQRMFDLAKHILWITNGAVMEEPHHMASIIFSRTVRREELHISLNHLDVSDPSRPDTSKSIAEHFLQLNALDEWETDNQLLWSKEPEAFLDAGKLKLPRLLPDTEQNARLNASRRTVTKTLSASSPSTNVEVVQPLESSAPDVVELLVPGQDQNTNGASQPACIESSSLMALCVGPDAFLFLAGHTDEINRNRVLSLATTNSYKTTPIASVTISAEDCANAISTEDLVVATTSELIANSVMQHVSSGARVLLHCSTEDSVLISALRRRAASKEIHLILTCDAIAAPQGKDLTFIDLSARGSQHALRKTLNLVRPTHFIDLTPDNAPQDTRSSELSLDICRALPAGCRSIDAATFFQRQSSLPRITDEQAMARHLEAIAQRSLSAISSSWQSPPAGVTVPVNQLRDAETALYATTTICWPHDGLIEARVRPFSANGLFSPDKAYLLVGLSGDIGQSLCEYMVSNGAGCVCLTSRSPKVDEKWLASIRQRGADVRVFALDVTNRSAADEVVKQIRASCPPIAGVAHGANVLSDVLFARTSINEMTRTLSPKVDGAHNLDQIFYEDDLDFFVLFSSVSSLAGNIGQSAYVAANGYLNGLARQRRRRGLAASAFDIGRVVGLGVIETSGQHVVDQLLALGLPPLGESDLRLAFAETILMGYPSPKDQEDVPHAVVTTTVRRFRDDEDGDVKGPWFSSPLFSHLITESASGGPGGQSEQDGQGAGTTLRVGEQLSNATSMEQAQTVLQDCFAAKLRVILQIMDETLDHNVPVVELGIDSLVAVEVRSWFLKELKVDVPVLKVIGGASIAELCESALEKLPKDSLASIGKEDTKPVKAAATKAEPSPAKAKPATPETSTLPTDQERKDSISSSSASDGELSQGGSSDAQMEPTTSITSIATTPSRAPSPPADSSAKPKKFLKTMPISFAQSRYWFLHQLLEDPRTSNVAACYHVQGNLRVADFERATRLALGRHEALRTCFVQDDSDAGHAYQSVLPHPLAQLKCEKAKSADEVMARFAELREHNFDLSSGDLLQMVLVTLSPSSHYLLVHHHHIIMDGVSVQVLLADMERAYNGQSLGPAPRQYPDFSVAQRQDFEKGSMNDELQFWKKIFPAGEQPPVLPLLPMARTSSRMVMKQYDTHEIQRTLAPEVAARIRLAAKKQASTPFHFYLAAFEALLFRFTDAEELTIGMADAARNTGDLQGSVGFFLNLLALRFRRQLDQRFDEAITNARRISHAALNSSRLPFDVLLTELGVARSSSHSPLFQAFIDYRQGSQEGKQPWANCELAMQESTLGKTAYDVTLDVTATASHALISLRVQKSLYDTRAADLLIETYVHLLEAFASDSSQNLSTPSLFSEKMLARAVEVGRGPEMSSDWPETLPHRIDEVAQKFPDQVALMDGHGAALTYSSMLARIESIAEALEKAQVKAGARVLVFQQAAADWACSMLAIMRVGAVYVPMDLRNPVTRLAAVAADCDAAAILADVSTINDVPQLNAPQAHVINISDLPSSPAGSQHIANRAQASAPAAILYTSGSTGTPKGIVVLHSGLRNEIEGYTKTWKLGAERVLQQSAFTFDFASDEFYTGLVNGGMVYVVPWSARGSPLDITEIIWKQGITYTRATPSEYLLWLQYGGENLQKASAWRYAFAGGETLNTSVLQELCKLDNPHLRFFNSYGPAETSISSCKGEVDYRKALDSSSARIPCGYSLPNYHTYIVNENLQPQPVDMPGEVCIGGAGVSQGYLNNKELTDRHFVANPFAKPEDISKGWTRMYRSGDIGHLSADGALVFHGRKDGDTQVKIRGLRIDLSDIESNVVATAQGALREAVVTLRDGDPPFLVAHVVFASEHTVSDRELYLERLLSQLSIPQYMVPVVAIPVDELPLTNHSKIDRKAVQALPLQRKANSANQDNSSLSETMIHLQDIWHDVLGPKVRELGLEIGPSTNFFSIGGNSLLVIRLQSRIQQIFNIVIPLVKLLSANTLAEMAETMEDAASATTIDWEKETAPPKVPSFLADISSAQQDAQRQPKTVLVTGGTGYLARRLLPILAESPNVSAIHCVAVREERPDNPRNLLGSEKITWHQGDLSMSLLGLKQDVFHTLASQADVILHLGAARAIWDSYHTLRASNVHPTRELVKLAAPRHTPIYFISTVAASADSAPSIAASSPTPSVDGADGYVASKWASERILARSADKLGVPSTTYRFLPMSESKPAPKRLMDELVELVGTSGVVPDSAEWTGSLYMTPADEVAQSLATEIVSGNKQQGATVEHYQCDVTLTGDEINQVCEQTQSMQAQEIPMLKWFGRIKKLGFDYFIASHDASVGGADEGRMGSRR